MTNAPFLARWGLLIAAIALALAFVGVTGWTYIGLRAQAEDLVRSQGEGMLHLLAAELRTDFAGEGTPDTLAHRLEERFRVVSAEGVLWIALVDADGNVLAQAGSKGESDDIPTRPGDVRVWGNRARLMAPPPAPPPESGGPHPVAGFPEPGAAPGAGRRPPPRLVLDFVPTLAQDLEARAANALVVAVLAAVLLVGLAVLSWRARLQLEIAEREISRTRHLAALGEVSAVLAHEIRNPLTALKGHAQLLVEGEADARKQRRAERVVRGAERLEHLTNDLLSFARTAELHRTPSRVMECVRTAMEGLEHGRIHVEDHTGTVPFALDAPRFAQVVANLLTNALQHSPDDAQVDLTVRLEGRMLDLRVRDRGVGVPEAEREHIFEPFVTGRQRGTGLGLPLARRICQLHGGTLTVSNHPEGGAVFQVRIPET